MTDHPNRSAENESERAGPPRWPYSTAEARANNVIWRLCQGVSPQGIYDALDKEGLAIVEKITPTPAQPTGEPGEEDVAIALFVARHHGLTNIMPWADIDHDGRDYWRTIARNLMRTHRVVPASQPSPAATVEPFDVMATIDPDHAESFERHNGSSAGNVDAAQIVREEWQRLVKEFKLKAGSSVAEALTSRILERLSEAVPQSARDGVAAIAAERRRQIEKEGWTPEHDDSHIRKEMAVAAACYVMAELMLQVEREWVAPDTPKNWPWHFSWWKPGFRRQNLVKAGALIAAEIDRIDRASPALSRPQLGSGK